jgi:hypothetical protein
LSREMDKLHDNLHKVSLEGGYRFNAQSINFFIRMSESLYCIINLSDASINIPRPP